MMSSQLGPQARHVIVIGAGIVGLACAWHAAKIGMSVTVVDRDIAGDRASHGNAGGIAISESTPLVARDIMFKAARWLIDPLGPLALKWRHLPSALPWFIALNKMSSPNNYNEVARALSALNSRVFADLIPFLTDIGALDSLYRRGALTVYETDSAFQADSEEWQFKRELGIRWREISPDDLVNMEPSLAPVFRHGIFIDEWAHVGNPERLVGLARSRLIALGAKFVEASVTCLNVENPLLPSAVLESGVRINGSDIIVATGAWSAKLASSIGDRVLLESERGYNTTLPAPGVPLFREVIFAERKFVATPLDIGIRIGGAAEFAGLTEPPNYRRSDALLKLGQKFIPGIRDEGAVKWMGHRPATPDSLPVIGRSPRCPSVIYAFGHGHLGLTQASTTGALVSELLMKRPPSVPLDSYSIARFGS